MKKSSLSVSLNPHHFLLKPLCMSLAMIVGSASLVACGGSSSDSSSSSSTSTVGTASVSAMIKDSNGNPLSNVGIYDSDNTSDVETSNSAGYVYIGKLTNADNSLINLVASGYAKQSLILPLATNPNLTNLNVQMLKLVPATDGTDAIVQSGDSAKTFTSGSNTTTGSQIDLTYANLVANGTATVVTSNVTVYLTDISTSQLGVLPNGLASTVAVYGATNLQMNDVFVPTTTQTSDPYGQLSLVGLKTATPVRIAVTGSNLPATTSLYYFDDSAKAWKADGTLTLTTLNGSQYYTGTTTHTGYLVAGASVSATQTLTGTVKDSSGNAIANAQIIATAPNGTATAYSSSTGSYTLSVPQTSTSQTVTLTAVKGNLTATGSNTSPNLVLATSATTSSSATGTLTWTKTASNLDLNVMLPTGEIVYLNNVGSNSTDPYVALTQGTLQDSLNYKQLLVGTHRIFVYNIGRSFNPSISGAGTSVSLTAGTQSKTVTPQASYTSTDKELTSESTPMYDNRSMAWYAMDMTVASNCSVTFSEPDTATYRRWLDSTQFAVVANANNANSKNYMQIRLDGTAQTLDGTGAYCSAN